MGRPRKHGKHLPKFVYQRNGGYYLRVPSGDQVWYKKDLPRLLQDWARIYGGLTDCRTLGDIFDHYTANELPSKAASTQRDYGHYMNSPGRLREVFGHCKPDEVMPRDFARYHKMRSVKSQFMANREISFMRMLYRYAICEGWATDNPAAFVRRNTERSRQHYATDAEFMAVYRCADAKLRVAMALAYLTGMRQGDLLQLRRTDFNNDGLFYGQSKTGNPLHVQWSRALHKAYRRAVRLYDTPRIYVLTTRSGKPYTGNGFRSNWRRAMDRAVDKYGIKRFQFKDIRAKTATDNDDENWQLLGHTKRDIYDRVYVRKPKSVRPLR